MSKTAALYARYSSDLQKDSSIDDQFAVCRKLAKTDALKVTATFADRAKSGSSMFERDGLRDMMVAAKSHSFDVLIVESLDRLSRDQEDLAGLHKRLTFYGVEIRTVSEGVTTSMHVGIRGLVGSMYLTDLAAKMRRAQGGRVREGKVPGSVAYGYRLVPGKPGEREIDTTEAAVLRRIFKEYAGGRSPRTIALGLTADGIPSPTGASAWSYTSLLTGNDGRGMLGNPMYAGKLVWNHASNASNPDTGKRIRRHNAVKDHNVTDVPHLRIIDQSLWDAANTMRHRRSVERRGGTVVRRESMPRVQHLLSGLLRCGVCGGPMRITSRSWGGRRVSCVAAYDKGTCAHSKSYGIDKLQEGVLAGMRDHLTNPQAIAEAARAYHAEWADRQKASRTEVATVRKQLTRVEVQIDRIVTAITDSDQPIKVLTSRLAPLEAQRAGLAERLRLLDAEGNVVTLHPNVLETYQVNVKKLSEALTRDALAPENHAAFRNLIDTIVVHQTPTHQPYEFTPYGRLGAILGTDLFPSVRSTEEIVSAEGVTSCATTCVCDHTAGSGCTLKHCNRRIMPLGRWKVAA